MCGVLLKATRTAKECCKCIPGPACRVPPKTREKSQFDTTDPTTSCVVTLVFSGAAGQWARARAPARQDSRTCGAGHRGPTPEGGSGGVQTLLGLCLTALHLFLLVCATRRACNQVKTQRGNMNSPQKSASPTAVPGQGSEPQLLRGAVSGSWARGGTL